MNISPADEDTLREQTPLLLGEDEDARYDAARVIARMGRPVLDRALAWADDPRPRMREMACFILGQIGERDEQGVVVARDPEGIPVLLRLLETDPEAEVRSAAAAALGHHAAPATVPALVRAVSDPSEDVRFDVATALGSFYWIEKNEDHHKGAAAAALLRLMDDEDEDVRDWATFGIHQGRHDTPETRARLWQALDDPNSAVRGEAAEGLALFGDRSLIPRLDALLREDDELPSHYFTAAEEFGDPILLPAVEVGAERWLEMQDELHATIVSALEALGGQERPEYVTGIRLGRRSGDRRAHTPAVKSRPPDERIPLCYYHSCETDCCPP